MKKILLVLCILFPMFISAQIIQVNLDNGKSFIGKLKNIDNGNIVLWAHVFGTKVNSVQIQDITSIIGDLHTSQKKTILKINPSIIFHQRNVTEKDLEHQNTVVLPSSQQQNLQGGKVYYKKGKTYYQPSAGDLLQIAGKRYLIGVGTALGGSILTIVGAYQDNNTLTYIGSGVIIAGAIISITGHFKLIEAGKAMNREVVTLSASDNGIGLAINF